MNLKEKENILSYKEYYCNLTEELDQCAGFDTKKDRHYRHYGADYRGEGNFDCISIRVPGGTVGAIWVNENNVITEIKVDTDYVVRTYSNELSDIIQKYIGEKIEFER